jgi:phage gp36-like protein
MCEALVELYRLRCQMQLAAFEEELRRDSATVRRALDEAFWKIDRQIEQREGRQP